MEARLVDPGEEVSFGDDAGQVFFEEERRDFAAVGSEQNLGNDGVLRLESPTGLGVEELEVLQGTGSSLGVMLRAWGMSEIRPLSRRVRPSWRRRQASPFSLPFCRSWMARPSTRSRAKKPGGSTQS